MVGIGDVAVMDYDIGYYRTDFQVLRLTVRQLYSWPAIPPASPGPRRPEPGRWHAGFIGPAAYGLDETYTDGSRNTRPVRDE